MTIRCSRAREVPPLSPFGERTRVTPPQVYGGRRGIYGNLQSLLTKPYADRKNSSTMVGIGTSELQRTTRCGLCLPVCARAHRVAALHSAPSRG